MGFGMGFGIGMGMGFGIWDGMGWDFKWVASIVTIAKDKNETEIIHTVCPLDRVYDVLCKIYANVLGVTKVWDVV